MKPSVAKYAIYDFREFEGLVWETELGLVVSTKGKIDPNANIEIMDVETNEVLKSVDIRNLLMEILPR
jgi:hypothetical protein